MAKRTKNGATDPYISRRVGGTHRKAHRQAVMPLARRDGLRDDAGTSRALSDIARQARDKEYQLASAGGPHSTPEQHYPKSFQIPEKKEEEE